MSSIGPRGLGVFIRPQDGTPGGGLVEVPGQWGMIRPGAPTRTEAAKDGRPKMTNNARSETMAKLPTFRQAWAAGQRCLIPARSYQEPNWETGKNVWWALKPARESCWGLAGLWSEWTDPETGEVVPNYTMPTVNVDEHPLLNRMHRPDKARSATQQDKRAVVALAPQDWEAWLFGSNEEALEVLRVQPPEAFDAGPVDTKKPGQRQRGLFG